MTLKKSSSKSAVFSVLITELYQMRLLLILFGLILLVLPNLATLAEFTNRSWGQYDIRSIQSYILSFVGCLGYAPMAVLAMGMSVMSFGYLHKRQKLDYFHALPVRRTTHFLGRVLAALMVLLAAGVLIALGQTFSLAVTLGFGMPQVYGYIWYVSLMIVLPAFASYLFTTLIIVLTANPWETIFSLLATTAIQPVVVVFTGAIVSSAIPVSQFFLEWENVAVLSPLLYGIGAVIRLDVDMAWTDTLACYLLVLLQILVCGVLAWYFFKKRKSEQAESGGPTRFKLVVRFCTAVCASTLFSLAMLYITSSYVGYLVGSVLGLLIAWLILELLYSRTLRRAMKCLVPNLIGYAVFVVLNLLVAFGLVGVPRLPDLAEINAVSVQYSQDVRIDDTHVRSEGFNSSGELVYTGRDSRYVQMASFAESDVTAGYELAKAILQNQKDLYFPYIPTEWGFRSVSEMYELPDHSYVHVSLYMEDEALQLSYDDRSTRGNMEAMYDIAKAIAASPEYTASNPALAIMEQLDYVMYENYSIYDISQQYTLEHVEDREAFIRELQAAYIEDLYSEEVYEEVVDPEVHDETSDYADSSVEAVPPEEYDSHYVLCFDASGSTRYFDPQEALTLQGGIIDDFYPAEGLECWLNPQYTEEDPEYWVEASDRPSWEFSLYRTDFPKTCAVLDQLRPAEE